MINKGNVSAQVKLISDTSTTGSGSSSVIVCFVILIVLGVIYL